MVERDNSAAASPNAALRCSFAAEARGDALAGTAAPSEGFLLIEAPGAWGRTALIESGLDPAIGAAVGTRAMATGLRTLLIRRPGRPSEDERSRPKKWAIVDSTPGSEDIRWGTFGSDEELLDLPLDGSAGAGSDDPCYLVCTHGRHDACCAIRGRPLAASLDRDRPGQVWECSHVGGDRFAANLVVLPHGMYYGRVDAEAAREIAAAHDRGHVALPWLRGRTSFAPAAQAAQHFARVRLDEQRVNALTPHQVEDMTGGRWRVHLSAEPIDFLVTVAGVAAGPTAFLTCAASSAAHPPAFRLEDMSPVA